jgi:PII-like signaling protein
MKISEEGRLLRVFIGESDRWEGKPLYEALIFKAREAGLAGATMVRGLMGYGAASRIHTAKILRLSEDLPVIVEIVDSEENISSFLRIIDEMIQEGMVTIEPVQVVFYRHNGERPSTSASGEWE